MSRSTHKHSQAPTHTSKTSGTRRAPVRVQPATAPVRVQPVPVQPPVPAQPQPSAQEEIDAWVASNKDKDIRIRSFDDSRIILMMAHNGEHMIEINYPQGYPEQKVGFGCMEIPVEAVTPMKFIGLAHNKFHGRRLKVGLVLSYLADAFTRLKNLNTSPTVPEPTSIVEATSIVDHKTVNVPHVCLDGTTDVDDAWEPVVASSMPSSVADDPFSDCASPVKAPAPTPETWAVPLHLQTAAHHDLDDTMVDALAVVNSIINESSSVEPAIEPEPVPAIEPVSMPAIESISTGLNDGHAHHSNLLLESNSPTTGPKRVSDSITESESESDSEFVDKDDREDSVDDTPADDIPMIWRTNRPRPARPNVAPEPPHVAAPKPISNRNFDAFVERHSQRLTIKYPSMEEDAMMTMIQDKWEKIMAEPNESTSEPSETTSEPEDPYAEPSYEDPDYYDVDDIDLIVDDDGAEPTINDMDLIDIQGLMNTAAMPAPGPASTITVELVNAYLDSDQMPPQKQPVRICPFDEPTGTGMITGPMMAMTGLIDEGAPSSIKSIIEEGYPSSITGADSIMNQTAESSSDDTDHMFDYFMNEDKVKPELRGQLVEEISAKRRTDTKLMCMSEDSDSEEKSMPMKPVSDGTMPKKPVVCTMTDSDDSYSEEEIMPVRCAKPVSKRYACSESDDDEYDIMSAKSRAVPVGKGRCAPIKAPTKPTPTPSVPNVVRYDDVDDFMGLYLSLGNCARNVDLPFDMDALYANAKKMQDDMAFGNASRMGSNKTFSSASTVWVVMNEFKNLYYRGLREHYSTSPIDSNIYHMRIAFDRDFFDTSSQIYKDLGPEAKVEIEIKLESKLYPFYPPKVKLISPRLADHMCGRIATMECLMLSRWNPTFGIETIIGHFQSLMNQYARIESVGGYDQLENELIELSLLTEIPARINSVLTLDELKSIGETTRNSNSTKSKKYWAAGTGYGYSGLSDWDFKAAERARETRDRQLALCIRRITVRLTQIIMTSGSGQSASRTASSAGKTGSTEPNTTDAFRIMEQSCYQPYLCSFFHGSNVLELLKTQSLFCILLDSMRILPQVYAHLYLVSDNSEKPLITIFGEIAQDCKTYLQTLERAGGSAKKDDRSERDLLTNFVAFYHRTKLSTDALIQQQQSVSLSTIIQADTALTISELYKAMLATELYDENEAIVAAGYESMATRANDKINTQISDRNTMRQISKELLSHSKSMPLEFASSIFYRYKPSDIRFHEFIITGPEGTPYDSGLFHFRMYCPSNYPRTVPQVSFMTVAASNGQRFNPNLYNCGRVCLSLLGTWSGHAGESWIPGTSTMLQVMVSLQSLVLVADPYYNETGYQTQMGSERGLKSSIQYSENVRLSCMRLAMTAYIKTPIPGFETATIKHFVLKSQHIKETCAQWVSEASGTNKDAFIHAYHDLCRELDALIAKSKSIVELPAEMMTSPVTVPVPVPTQPKTSNPAIRPMRKARV